MVVEESRLSASQLAALVDGMDWLRLEARDVMRPDIVKALRPIESGRSSHATMPHVPESDSASNVGTTTHQLPTDIDTLASHDPDISLAHDFCAVAPSVLSRARDSLFSL